MSRLVNMLDITNLTEENVWKIVKETRRSFLFENHNPNCQTAETLLSDYNIKININKLEEELKINSTFTTYPKQNMTFEHLNRAAELWTYLNFCPPKELSFKMIPVVIHVLERGSPRDIITALTRIMKTTKDAEKQLSIKVFTRIMDFFGLNQYNDSEFLGIL